MSGPSTKARHVVALSPAERYGYFIRKVCDFEVVWGLADDGWATIEADGATGIPVWPEREFAELCATGAWSRYVARAIPLAELMSRWLPGMATDSRVVSVFPVPEGQSKVVTAAVLAADLARELEQYA